MKTVKSTIEKFCKKHGLTVKQFYGKEKIEGRLDLNRLTSIPNGFNPTVGGSLYLDDINMCELYERRLRGAK